MKSIARDSLASRLRQNWSRKNPDEVGNERSIDDSLQSLQWLQELNIKNVPAVANTPKYTGLQTVNSTVQLIRKPVTCSINNIVYKADPCIKPPYSYSELIKMAIKQSNENKITISSLYKWITDNFVYYRMTTTCWRNSIRHNLSLNKRFEKVPRAQNESGRGSFWRIRPEYNNKQELQMSDKRKFSLDTEVPNCKRFKSTVNIMSATSEEEYSNPQKENVLQTQRLNCSSILQQAIEISGMDITPEQFDNDEDTLSSISTLNSPISDVNSDDLGLDDLLNEFSNSLANSDLKDIYSTYFDDAGSDWSEKVLNLQNGVEKQQLDSSFCYDISNELISISPLDEDCTISSLFDISDVNY